MPMPKPTSDETFDEFIERFMGDPVMIEDYPDESQRYAVGLSVWDNRNKAKGGETMNKREIKSIKFEVKASEEGRIEGYAAFFNNVDSYKDVIMPGAFKKSIENDIDNIKMFFNHDWSSVPIGTINQLKEDEKGLYFEAQLNNTALAVDVKEGIKTGAVNKMSIGFITEKSENGEIEGKTVRKLKEIKLFEISPVNFPANEKADITGYKNRGELMDNINERLNAIEYGLKKIQGTPEFKELNTTQTLRYMLHQKVKESIENFAGSLSINEIFINELVYNHWNYNHNTDNYDFDVYYKQSYAINGDSVELVGERTEVVPARTFVDKKNKIREKEIEEKAIMAELEKILIITGGK